MQGTLTPWESNSGPGWDAVPTTAAHIPKARPQPTPNCKARKQTSHVMDSTAKTPSSVNRQLVFTCQLVYKEENTSEPFK